MLLLLGVPQVPKLWRGESAAWDAFPKPWLRALPTIAVVGGVLLVLGIVAFLLPTDDHGAVPHWYGAVILGVTAVLLVLVASLVALGRPRALVPPHLRGGGPQRLARRAPPP